MTTDETFGLYKKYIVTHADGSPIDPNAHYFVLRLDADGAAREAAAAYADVIQSVNPTQAQDLRVACNRYRDADERDYEQVDPTLGWLCTCGHWQDNGLHCAACGTEPPWGCDCAECTDRALQGSDLDDYEDPYYDDIDTPSAPVEADSDER